MTMRPFDHATVALSGLNLIEASAGTGKTYAIASIYLRLLLEQELMPEQILVVTYTEAATRELRLRIRRRMREAVEVMEGRTAGDPFLSVLKDRAAEAGVLADAVERLTLAVAAFDTAAIFTIHSFCLRALQDNAFESGSLFDTGFISDNASILQECVDDFWRIRFFREESRLLDYAIASGFSPDTLVSFLAELRDSPASLIVPSFSGEQVASIEARCRMLYGEVSSLWTAHRSELVAILIDSKGLSRAKDSYKKELLPELFGQMDRFVAEGNEFGLFPGFEKLTSEGMRKRTTGKGIAPEHRLFDCCQELKDAADLRLLALKAELVSFCREHMPERKRERNVRSFDDLLSDLFQSLSGPDGEALSRTLVQRYRAALIDEFQDTDPVQYEIFRKIYHGSDAPLFLIGDPKQAIYSFRGADIFAYIQAAGDVRADRRFTLLSNWRSDPKLLDGFNILFDQDRRPFVFDAIAYHPLASGQPPAGDGGEQPPLEICFMDPVDAAGSLNTGKADSFATGACASAICRMLREAPTECGLKIGGRPVEASDIAVIVRTHLQGRQVQEALRRSGVPSVMRSEASVFSSKEAGEVLTLVSSIADPRREALVRAAMLTGLFGMNGTSLDTLCNNDSEWAARLRTFRDYHRIWAEGGIMVMSRTLLSNEGVRRRVLAAGGMEGHRKLTNILHCFEILHRQEHDAGLGPEALVSWFGERIADCDAGEEFQIRLESDEPAVRIVTVHVSKGLQYPVVFCPYMNGGIRSGGDIARYHDDSGRLVKDFGSPAIARHRLAAEREELAENLRLLYVALTRAMHRCILFTGRVIDGRNNRPHLSPAAYLLFASGKAKTGEEALAVVKNELAGMDAEAMADALESIASGSGGSIACRRLIGGMPAVGPESLPCPSPPSSAPVMAVRPFDAKLDHEWRVSSFSSLARHRAGEAELPDRDMGTQSVLQEQAQPSAADDRSIFSFERGARAGILMHSIFETLDFASPDDATVRDSIVRQLAKQGFDEAWEPTLTTMVQETLAVPLSSPEGSFTIGGLAPSCWRTELEFFFPLKRLTSAAFGEALSSFGILESGADLADLASSLAFQPARGVVMGFIDMVFEARGKFWLLDWKSNHLGNSIDCYRADQLTTAMNSNRYTLQYLLYTVALDRYLSLRVPGYSYSSHFGGAIYVFLRGVSRHEGESSGFFRDLPPEPLIRTLATLLIENGGAA